MRPVLTFELFGRFIVLSSYSTLLYLAAIVTLLLALAISRRRGLPMLRTGACLLPMAVATPIGARSLHAVLNRDLYIAEPERLLALDVRGFALYGGLLLSALVGVLACQVLSVNFTRFTDSATPALGFGIAIARVGCYLAGCCHGKTTTLPWGVVFPSGSNAHVRGVLGNLSLLFRGPQPVHPTQLYESTAALVGAVLASWLLIRKAPEGLSLYTFAVWFSAARWVVLYFRAEPTSQSALVWFHPLLYIAIILLSLRLILLRYPQYEGRIARSLGRLLGRRDRTPVIEERG